MQRLDFDAAPALVTGASSGLGAAFARELARRGSNLILIARREERLATLAAELASQFGVQAAAWPADLADVAGLEAIAQRVEALPALDLLVNNAGIGGSGQFADEPPAAQQRMVALHVAAPVRLCRAALPGMIARRTGALINVASLAAFFPVPGSALYCGTKASLVALSRTLHLEVRAHQIRVQALCPGFIHTEFHDALDPQQFDPTRIPEFMWCSAQQVAVASLDALAGGGVICVPGAQYRALYLLARTGLLNPLVPLAARRR